MKTLRSLVVAALAALASSHAASAQVDTYFVFKVTATIQASMFVPGGFGELDQLKKRTIKTNDLINMALGQPLTQKVDPKHPVYLALATVFDDAPPLKSKIVVFDPAGIGLAKFKATVMNLTTLDYINAQSTRRNGGLGFGTGKFVAATLGDFAKFGLLASDFSGSGLASGPFSSFLEVPGLGQRQAPRPSVGTATIQGRLKFNTTDANGMTTVFDGIFTRGAFVLSPKLLAVVE